ncbi:hypothetical protein ACMAUO_06150 [Gluconacetobacter sp. Hr-1-5]|uniref:hypothetical protein n=1 Tax=Gluconacetobacter sp. Hr-1-5 TaxID=3395370 RepID=UPI003B51BDEA
MTLSHPRDGSSVIVIASGPPPQSSQLVEGVARAPFIAQITADETGAAGFTPKKGDSLTDGPKTYTLTDASPVYDSAALVGWTLVSAGGQ